MMLLWACAGVPLGVYNIVQDFNIALQIQPQILTFLSLLTWAQCKYYGERWSLLRSAFVATPLALAMAGSEAGLIFALSHARQRHLQWPVTFMAVLSACFLCAGVLRHYWDIYKERTVRGISFLFVGIDAMGDLTSLISVFFQSKLDVLGMIIYGSELALWTGVFACGGWYNLRPWLKTKIQKHRGEEAGSGPVEGNRNAEEAFTGSRPHDRGNVSSSRSTSTVFSTASEASGELESHGTDRLRLRQRA